MWLLIYLLMAFNNWLPDWKGALNNFYDERLKTAIDEKSQEYKEILTKFQQDNKRFQNIVIIILLTGLTLTTIHYFWNENPNHA